MKKRLKEIFIFCCYFCVFYFLCRAKVKGFFVPLGISLLFAYSLSARGQFGVVFSYLLAFSLARLNPVWIIVASFECMAILGLFVIRKNIKARFLPYIYGGVMIFVQIPQIFIFAIDGIGILMFCISSFLSVCFYYLFCKLISAFRNRGMRANFLIDEVMAFFVLAVGIFLGSLTISWGRVSLSAVLTLISMFALVNLTSIYPVVFCAFASGFANMLAFNQYNILVIYMIWAVCLLLLKKTPKVITVVVLLIADIMLGFVFYVYESYGIENFLMICLSGMLYISLPSKIGRRIQRELEFVKPSQGQLEELFKKTIKDKLETFVELLYDIDSTYKEMILPMNTFENAKKDFAKDVCTKVCHSCINRKECFERNQGDVLKNIERAIAIGVKKGGINNLDVSSVMSKCTNIALMVSNIKVATNNYLDVMKQAGYGNMGKLVIGNQLKGVADSLNNFNKTLINESRAERKEEEHFLSELWFNDIIADDCQIILSQGEMLKSVSILLKIDTNKEKLLKVCENYFREKLREGENRYSKESGWSIVTFTRKPKFGFVFGSATIGHNGKIVNGDCHSCIKLEGDKYLLSIADGKGHGREAQKTSNLTMKLIEGFYRANISTDIVVSSVNQVLSFNSGENFSAVDICIVDLNDGEANFVKLGSTPTVIKRGDKVRVLSGSGLPIGISRNVTPSHESEFLNIGDIVVMTSDGVFDGFGDINQFAGYINNLKSVNMDLFAKKLLAESVTRTNGKIKDDLTVLAFRWLVDF